MLAHDENERVTRVGPGTPMGDTHAPLLDPGAPGVGAARARRPAGPRQAARRGARGLPRHAGPRRAARRALPAPAGVALPRSQRGVRPALRLPRLEVRRRGRVRGHDERARGAELRAQDPHHRLPHRGGGGLIWAYLGPAERRPPPPHFAWTQAAASHRHVSKVIQESNWLQGLEGGIDTSHAPILHRVLDPDSSRPGFKTTDPFVRGKAPVLELDVTDYGYRYAGRAAARRRRPPRPRVPLHPALPPDPARPHLAAPLAASPARPATSGSRWMTRPPWSTTGSTAPPSP